MNLENLHDLAAPLVPPYPPGYWPPAPWVGVLAAGALLLVIAIFWWRWYQRTRTRRYAYRELEAIYQRYQQAGDPQRYLYELNLLLRRLAVRNFQRDKVAALTGEDWLDFLDWSRGRKPNQDPGFREGSGKVLAWGAYQAAPDHFDAESLQQLVKAWIRRQT